MATPRRLLPSISLLTAFESVVRTGSTLAAARDLNLTQGAVSRLIQNLEAQLGVTLFLRERRRLVPTDHALAYARDVVKALDLISRGSMRVRSSTGGGTLSLAILPTFGTRWLAPRLPRFLAEHPGITINLGTRLKPFDFDEEGFDAAIHFGERNWAGTGSLQLFDERLVACCAPAFLSAHPVSAARDLIGLPLLQLETRPNAWAAWFAHHGVTDRAPQGMLFDQFAPMIQAVIHGLGVALLPEFLAKPELADGRLVQAFGGPVLGEGSYYLVWPSVGAWYPPLQAFRDWLMSEAADPDGTEMLPR
ncbi:Glycine cleavage system transcriptional activator [Defluviimonas aquaemixtae]|uniref:Glycine cleavage system transcriptional activator n=1 Tax=Albidovulum aquaemixtae TaxID=1542388 RepID=A0A2R8BK30_9RHOB|nr:LysR family transcriptional regulator [Defluviimonas aquaemixtae]SPH23663.1 Glycine cleavage system transcriptional activator [Defluviimonas aquaemixtae]